MDREEPQRTAPEAGFRRTLSYGDLVGIGVGGIIGSGWLFAVLSAASVSGPASLIAWGIGGGVSLLLALAWAELAGLFPRAGASTRIPFYTHGGLAGFQFGWVRYVSVAVVPAIEAEAVVTALAALFARSGIPLAITASYRFGAEEFTGLSGLGVALALGLLLGFAALNLYGIRALGATNRWVTVWKVIVPVLTIAALLLAWRTADFTGAGAGWLPYGPASVLGALGTSGIMFAYLGFAQMLDFGAEASRPGRDMPRALLTSVGLAAVIYGALSAAFLGAVRWSPAGLTTGDWAGLANSSWSTLPLYYAVVANPGLLFAAIGAVLLIDAWVSPSGTGWIYLGTSTRSLFGWGAEGYLPAATTAIDQRGVPRVALLISTGLGIVFLLPLPSWYLLVGLLSSATILTYVVGSVSVSALRRTAAGLARPFRMPAIRLLAPAGFILAALVVYFAGFLLLSWLVALTTVGELVYLAYQGPRRHELGRREAVAAAAAFGVLLAYLIAAGPVAHAGSTSGTGTSAGDLWSTSAVAPNVLSIALAGLLLAGPLLYLLVRGAPSGRRLVHAGAWLPLWLAALYPLSYFGEFGPHYASLGAARAYPVATALPFPVGTLLAALLAAVVFEVARKSAYRTAELDRATAGLEGVPASPGAGTSSEGQRAPLSRRPRSTE